MNEKISWDQSLVKKYSSSNHFKMLNQLRNEVKKYPLNNKKNITNNLINETNNENKHNENSSTNQNSPLIEYSKVNNEVSNNESTVSFNNSKDFSIYNNNKVEQQKSSEALGFSTFKDRLNQIDLK